MRILISAARHIGHVVVDIFLWLNGVEEILFLDTYLHIISV